MLHVQRSQALFSEDHTKDSFHNDAKEPSSVSDVRSPVRIFHAVGTSVIISSRALLLLVRGAFLLSGRSLYALYRGLLPLGVLLM